MIRLLSAVIILSMHGTAYAQGSQSGAGNWPMSGKDHANTRYSELTEISASNVRDLRLAFTFPTGVLRGQEAAPIVAAGTMYIVTPYPNIVYALDLTKPGAPAKWKSEPKPLAGAQGTAFDTGHVEPARYACRNAAALRRTSFLQEAHDVHGCGRRGRARCTARAAASWRGDLRLAGGSTQHARIGSIAALWQGARVEPDHTTLFFAT